MLVSEKIQQQALKVNTWCLIPTFQELLGRFVCKDTGLGSVISQAMHPTSTVTTRRATSAVIARQAASGSGGSFSSNCNPSDVACNYCALAVDQVNTCNNTILSLGLPQNLLRDCLCYKDYTDPTDGPFFAFAPNYLDAALRACPDWARTADTANYQTWVSNTGFCSSQGDYWTMGLTDTAAYRLAIATSAPSVSTTSATRSGSSAAVITTSPTRAVAATTASSTVGAVPQTTISQTRAVAATATSLTVGAASQGSNNIGLPFVRSFILCFEIS